MQHHQAPLILKTNEDQQQQNLHLLEEKMQLEQNLHLEQTCTWSKTYIVSKLEEKMQQPIKKKDGEKKKEDKKNSGGSSNSSNNDTEEDAEDSDLADDTLMAFIKEILNTV